MAKDRKGVDLRNDPRSEDEVYLGGFHSKEGIAKRVSIETGEAIVAEQIRGFTYAMIVNAVGPFLLMDTGKGMRRYQKDGKYNREIPVNSLTLMANPALKNFHVGDEVIVVDVPMKAVSKVSDLIAGAIKEVNLERDWTVALPMDFGGPVEKAKKSNGHIQMAPQAITVTPDAE